MKNYLKCLIVVLLFLFLQESFLHCDAISSTICNNAETVVKEKPPNTFEILSKLYKESKTLDNLNCVAKYLIQVDPDRAFNFFLNNLDDKEPNIAARAAHGLGILKDKRAINKLHQIFKNPESKIKCNVAYALGSIQDPSSLPLLVSELNSEYHATRRCVIRALTTYNDTQNCQKLYDLWMSDRAPFVRIDAGIGVATIDCENKIIRNKDYNINEESCLNYQAIVDKVSQAVVNFPKNKEWEKNIDLKNIMSQIKQNEPEKIQKAKLNLIMAIMDWGESVDDFHALKNWGTLEDNKKYHFLEILEYKRKEEVIKLFCPNLTFPDFSFWNKTIPVEQ